MPLSNYSFRPLQKGKCRRLPATDSNLQPPTPYGGQTQWKQITPSSMRNNTIVLLKENMTPLEKLFAVESLIRLVVSLAVELEGNTDNEADDDDDEADDEDFCDDTIPIPVEAFEDAGIWGKDLHIQVINGAVIITADEGSDADA